MKSIFSKSLKLVQVLSKDNKEVQESLFYHLDTLLEVSIVPSDLALAIKEVCTFTLIIYIQHNIAPLNEALCYKWYKISNNIKSKTISQTKHSKHVQA